MPHINYQINYPKDITKQGKNAIELFQQLVSKNNALYDNKLINDSESEKLVPLILQKKSELEKILNSSNNQKALSHFQNDMAQCNDLLKNSFELEQALARQNNTIIALKQQGRNVQTQAQNLPNTPEYQVLKTGAVTAALQQIEPSARNLAQCGRELAIDILAGQTTKQDDVKRVASVMKETATVINKIDKLKAHDLLALTQHATRINQTEDPGKTIHIKTSFNWGKFARNLQIFAGAAMIVAGIIKIAASPLTFGISAIPGLGLVAGGLAILSSAGVMHLTSQKDKATVTETHDNQAILSKSEKLLTQEIKLEENQPTQQGQGPISRSPNDPVRYAPNETRFHHSDGRVISPPVPQRPHTNPTSRDTDHSPDERPKGPGRK